MTLEEKIILELKSKIIKELISQVNGNIEIPLKLNYQTGKEINIIEELIKENTIYANNEEYFLCKEIKNILESNKLKLKIEDLPLEIDLESKDILKQLNNSSRRLAELKGVGKSIPNSLILVNALVLQEAKDSSQIENIITTNDELYKAEINIGTSSFATKEVQNYASALKKGFYLVKENKSISIESIIEIQKELETIVEKQGIRKKFGTLIMNQSTREILHVPPQDEENIILLLKNLESYMNNEDGVDPLIKLAVIHHRFESIHPFPDGNGRTGRIINILYLILNDLLELPILYLSSYLIKNKNKYYNLLKKVDTENQWEEWILFILKGIEETAVEAVELIGKINLLMEEAKKEIIEKQPKIYSKDLLELLFIHPYTKINFVVERLGKERKTASKILNELVEIKILKEVKLGKEKYFINEKLYELFRNR